MNNEPIPLLIRGGRIVDPGQGIDQVGDLLIDEGRIVRLGGKIPIVIAMSQSTERSEGAARQPLIIDATGLIVCPGFVDLHCHLREPGFEDKETIATGTKAAAVGGFTTVCCMANTNPPLDNRVIVDWVKQKANKEGFVHLFPIGCITKGRRGEEICDLAELAEAGVVAFSDDGDPVSNSQVMRHALDYSRTLDLPIIDHCEDKILSAGGVMNEGQVSARLGLKGIPAAAEEVMVARDLILAKLTGARLHIAHVSTSGAVELIRQAKEKGISVTAEATPHHLTLTEESIMSKEYNLSSQTTFSLRHCEKRKRLRGVAEANPERDSSLYTRNKLRNLNPLAYDTNAKVNPPLRSLLDITYLIRGLKDGVIDAIATDHAPHTLADKNCELDLAAFGISGFETAFGCLMGLVHRGEIGLTTLISRLTYQPARIIGKDGELGVLKVGAPANITIFDPDREWIVDSRSFVSKGKNSPFHGYKLKGKVMATVVDGKIAYMDEGLCHSERSEESHG